MKRRKYEPISAVLFLLPAIIPLTVFWVWPMLASLGMSLTDWDYISPTYNVVGLENYKSLVTDQEFWSVLMRSFYFMAGTVIPTLIGGLALALLLQKEIAGSSVYRAILFSPWVTPTVAVSIVWSWIFQPRVGLANWLLSVFHLPALGWLSSSTWAMPAVMIVTVWKGIGWAMIFYQISLQKVPKDLYEAASMDGASVWSRFRNVTLPMISPTTFFLTLILMVDSLQAYDQIQVLTQGGPAGSTSTILYLYYQTAFEQFNIGRATAIATLLVVITGMIAAVQFWMSKRWVHYHS